jgi:dihydropteroate synthase
MLPGRCLDWPCELKAETRFHLRPLPCSAANATPKARVLAGGPLMFDAAELILLTPGCAPWRARAPLTAIEDWAARAGLATRVEMRLAALATAPALPDLPARRPLIMGVVNVTPDSFSDGGEHLAPEAAAARARALVAAGADIVDLGAESTRPGAGEVPAALQLDRLLPVLDRLGELGAPISIDTRSAAVMRQALAAGAGLLNDVSGFRHDPESLAVAAAAAVPVVLMHSRATPATMQRETAYGDVLLEVHDALEARLAALAAAGVAAERVILDPGFGFAKTAAHNLALLSGLSLLHGLGRPLLAGLSRKSFIGRLSRGEAAKDRLGGSLAAAIWALGQGAQILRVHDVAETRQAVAIWYRLLMPTDSIKEL